MAQVVTPPGTEELPTLSMAAISHLKQGLEEAIWITLQGNAAKIEIAVLTDQGEVIRRWRENARRS